ncbi:MAG: hypothetical protein ACM3JD_08300 [Rudaea sp.]
MKDRSPSLRILVLLLAVVVLALVVPASVGLAKGNYGNPGVLPPDSHPFGKTYAEWNVAWWRWVYKTPAETNPLFDPTGANCEEGQSGPVWFLAGTAGGATTRHCTIPAGKAIFFPVINVNVDYPCPGDPWPVDNQAALTAGLRDFARFIINGTTGLYAKVDGRNLRNLDRYRAISPLFWFKADPSLSAAWGDACLTGQDQVGVADGYWIMLAPLAVGEHELSFGGWFKVPELGLDFPVDVSYHLTVKPGN